MTDALKRTPVHGEHEKLGAKLVPFAGWAMPVHYPAGILEEHRAVRTTAGLFDVSHMGELDLRGAGALALAQRVTTNDVSKLAVGQAQYGVMCREDGGAIDDCITYRFADRYMIVVNASNREKDHDWVRSHASGDVQLTDVSDDVALLALQGPRSATILARLTDTDLTAIAYYHFTEGTVAGVSAVISRTGYTGEDGFELYVPSAAGAKLWSSLLDAGRADGLIAAGLGARDSLRLEMGYALYGNDLDETRTPLEAGLGWVTKLDKGDFIGRAALVRRKEAGLTEQLSGFALQQRGFPRHGYGVWVDGARVSEVTSGVLSPSLQQGIGLAYVPVAASKPGTAIEIEIRDRRTPARIVRPPFYTAGSIRR